MFVSILSLWSIQVLDTVTPDSARAGVNLLAWISALTSHWLGTPIISVPLLPQHMPYTIQTVDGSSYDWVGLPIPPLVTGDGQFRLHILYCEGLSWGQLCRLFGVSFVPYFYLTLM